MPHLLNLDLVLFQVDLHLTTAKEDSKFTSARD